ncbi:MAG TPA: adenylate/guanylate cyclase domain-containing protein [Chroococcales cyanobacterium]
MNSDRAATGKGSILVVDDTPEDLHLLATILSEQGYDVRKLINGQLALSVVQTVLPDLILLDINLSGIDGYQICQHLKASPLVSEIPVIFISTVDGVLDKDKVFAVGGIDYISKPFHGKEILTRIEHQLNLRWLQQQLAEQKAQLQEAIRTCDREMLQREATVQDCQQAKASLRLSEEKFSKTFRSSPNPIAITTLAQARYVEVNDSFVSVSGYDREEIIGYTSLEREFWVNPADRDHLRQVLQEQGIVRNQEFDFRVKSGEIRTGLLSAEIIILDGQECVLSAIDDISDRKRAEAALKEKEQILRLVIDNIPQQIFWKDTNLVFLGCNKNWAQAARIDNPDSVVGKTDYDLLANREIAEHYRERDRRVIATNQPESHLVEIKQKLNSDGQPIWLDVNRVPIHDSEGNAIGVLGTIEDITQRKQAEDALQESQRQLRNQNAVLVQLAKNKALYQGDLKTTLRAITEAAARTLEIERASVWLYDQTASKLQCLNLFEFSLNRHSAGAELLAEDYPAYFQALEEEWAIAADDAYNDPRTREFAESHMSTSGIASMLDTPIRLGGHTVGAICLERVGQVRNWTLEEQNFASSLADLVSLAIEARERQRAQFALQQAEEKYRSIFENAAEGIFQTTRDGRYLSANPALARMYGYSSAEELIAQVTDIGQQIYVDPNRRTEFIAAMEHSDGVSRFELQVYRQDGRMIWVSENARAVKDAEGRLLFYEGTVEDITLRKQAEEALRAEQERSERLLLNILPKAIAERLKQAPSAIAEQFNETTILFADLVSFTPLASQMSPTELVNLLNQIFSTFDQLVERHGLEKIKTIGDAYMVAGGLPMPRSDHAEAVAEMALDMQREIARFRREDGKPFRLRIGINTGSVVAGVIGIKKFIYDLWGDAVNVASRMESQGSAGRIQVTAVTYERLKGKYWFEERGVIDIKGKGEMTTYWLTGKKES